jgi:hypothetical protein
LGSWGNERLSALGKSIKKSVSRLGPEPLSK